MYDVFISYVHGQQIAETMKKALEKEGLKVFIDKSLSIGSSLVMSLNKALKESKSYLLIIDETFISSEWTKQEAQAAFLEAMKVKKLFPLLVDEKAKRFWIEENPLFANYLGRTWEESEPDLLAKEIMEILR